MSEKEKGTNNSRFREIISVLRKHNITHGISPKKLRLIMEDLGPDFCEARTDHGTSFGHSSEGIL